MIWLVIWVMLMMFWLFVGYHTWTPTAGAAGIGTAIIPWLCVLIIGLILFKAIAPGPIWQ